MKAGDGTTVLGRGTKLTGELASTEDVLIEGEIEGTIRLTGARLTVGAEAHVLANIGAQDVVVFGRVEGDIRAKGRVELRASAVVTGDIFAARLSIEENATLRGQLDPSRASEETPATAARAAVAPKHVAGLARLANAVQEVLPANGTLAFAEPKG